MEDYKTKYLKYKNKYLELKKLLGGSKDTRICTHYLKNKCRSMNLDRCNNGIHITREMIDNDPEIRLCQECATTPFCERECDLCVRNKKVVQTELDHAQIILSDLEKKIIVAQKLVDEKNAVKVQSRINKTRMGTPESIDEYKIIKKEAAIAIHDLQQLQTSKNDIKQKLKIASGKLNIECTHQCECEKCKYGNCPNKENCIRSHNIDRRKSKLRGPAKEYQPLSKPIEQVQELPDLTNSSQFPLLETPASFTPIHDLVIPRKINTKQDKKNIVELAKKAAKIEYDNMLRISSHDFETDFADIKLDRKRKLMSREFYIPSNSFESHHTVQPLPKIKSSRLQHSSKHHEKELLDHIFDLLSESEDKLKEEKLELEKLIPSHIIKNIISNIDYGIDDIEELGKQYQNIKKQINNISIYTIPNEWDSEEDIENQLTYNKRIKLVENLNIIRYIEILKRLNNTPLQKTDYIF